MPNPAPLPTQTSPSYPAIKLDWVDWLPMIEDASLTLAEKRQHIETLHAIMVLFVDFGWDIAPAQENSGQALDLTTALRAAVVNFNDAQEREAV